MSLCRELSWVAAMASTWRRSAAWEGEAKEEEAESLNQWRGGRGGRCTVTCGPASGERTMGQARWSLVRPLVCPSPSVRSVQPYASTSNLMDSMIESMAGRSALDAAPGMVGLGSRCVVVDG